MSAFKRKRGGQARVDKTAKKTRFVKDEGEEPDEVEQGTKNEITVPAPVSLVSVGSCFRATKVSG